MLRRITTSQIRIVFCSEFMTPEVSINHKLKWLEIKALPKKSQTPKNPLKNIFIPKQMHWKRFSPLAIFIM